MLVITRYIKEMRRPNYGLLILFCFLTTGCVTNNYEDLSSYSLEEFIDHDAECDFAYQCRAIGSRVKFQTLTQLRPNSFQGAQSENHTYKI